MIRDQEFHTEWEYKGKFKLTYKPFATSKIVCFVLISNSFPPLTSFTKISILDVAGVLDLPMNAICFEMYIYHKNQIKIK